MDENNALLELLQLNYMSVGDYQSILCPAGFHKPQFCSFSLHIAVLSS
jgi:hypothetical protein